MSYTSYTLYACALCRGAQRAPVPIFRVGSLPGNALLHHADGRTLFLQALQLTISDDTYEYYDNYEVYDLYDIYNYYSNCKRLPFEGSSRAAGEGWLV